MATTRTKYIGYGTGILTIVALLGWFINSENFNVQVSGDIFCTDKCISYFNITSKYYDYYLYNKQGVKLDFVPEIKDYAICKPDKRCKSCGKCPSGWKEIDFAKPLINTTKYVYKFTKGKKEEFMLIGYKDTFQTIKWGLNAVNEAVDPIWKGIDKIETCKTRIEQDICKEYINTTYCFVSNNTCHNETVVKSNICNEKEVKYDCVLNQIQTDKFKIICPEEHKCDIIEEEFCVLDCNDGDCNYNAKEHLEKGWSRVCLNISNLKKEEIKISNFKDTKVDVENA